MVSTIETEIFDHLHQLPVEQQRHVLEYVRSLAKDTKKGVSGEALLRFAGVINSNDLTKMTEAIEAGCEQIDARDW